ncbi:MAG TPA: DUF2844 domain-containing protein [Steroidobacteraceae bacterium]|jgi:hypothetical protein|nr:DUF2844 domain-containing protein [Steroidobacteraceae bacterium]
MTIKHPSILLAGLALGMALTAAPPARAALGGNADSVGADSTALQGQLRSTSLVQYDVESITSGALVVHEYLTLAGQVFAVTWAGPVPPNLQQLLGSYFGEFQSAALAAHRANPGMRRQLDISQSDLVVESSGRLRDFHGLAYVPSLVPAGVALNELQ